MIVKVNNDILNQEKNKITEYIKDYHSCVDEIDEILLNIAKSWKGTDYDYFKKNIDILISEIKQMEDQVSSYNAYLEGYDKATSALDIVYKDKKIEIE